MFLATTAITNAKLISNKNIIDFEAYFSRFVLKLVSNFTKFVRNYFPPK